MKKIVLASASPRRKELLAKLGLKFKVDPGDYEEELTPGLEPHQLAKKLSLEKARAIAPKYQNAVIIAADTFGVLEDSILGKPHNEREAGEMLAAMSGKMHLVITGFTILDTETGKTLTRSVETKVYFKQLTPEEIETYVKSGEPLDKAGAYAIQGLGAVLVERLDGDSYNVIGLPLAALAESLKEFGVKVL